MVAITRRALFGACAAVAASIGVGGVAWAIGSKDDLLRPPGAQDENNLLALCVKCDRCRSVCPTGVISIAQIEDGLVAALTPTLDFHKGVCDFCGKCAEVCITGAIGSFDENTDKIGVAIVQEDRCVAYFGGCAICVSACPYEAISIDSSNHPVVDASLCNGCGACVDACPALVYRSFSGGTRRGIEVVTTGVYERVGTTSVSDGSEVGLT